MEAEMIISFFRQYGWQLGLLALSGMVLLGFLKWVGCFKKLPTKAKKYVYYALNCFFSIVACTVYILVMQTFEWINWAILCGSVVLFTGGVYTAWENTHLRDIWKKVVLNNISKFFKWLVSVIVNGTLTKEKLQQKALALGSEALNNLVAQAKALEAKKAEEARIKAEEEKAKAEKEKIEIKV